MIKIGDIVSCGDMPIDSHYKFICGEVTAIRNGWASINAIIVQSKWDDQPEHHPGLGCRCGVRLDKLRKVDLPSRPT